VTEGTEVYFRAEDGHYYRGVVRYVSPQGRSLVEYRLGQGTETFLAHTSNLSTTPIPTAN
jgi:hypothetical protein